MTELNSGTFEEPGRRRLGAIRINLHEQPIANETPESPTITEQIKKVVGEKATRIANFIGPPREQTQDE